MTFHHAALRVTQHLRMATNRYDIHTIDEAGRQGTLLATARQKRLALRERVTFWVDEDESREAFSLTARQRVDLGATYDITEPSGAPLATLRKDYGRSLLRSTFHLSVEGGPVALGAERHLALALVRRFGELPVPITFDFRDSTGKLVLTSKRAMGLRDAYAVTVPDAALDWRVAAAVAVGLDALMDR